MILMANMTLGSSLLWARRTCENAPLERLKRENLQYFKKVLQFATRSKVENGYDFVRSIKPLMNDCDQDEIMYYIIQQNGKYIDNCII